MKTFKVPTSIKRMFPKVTRVINSRKAVRINVSAKDCADGKKLNSNECALAKVTRRQFKADAAVIRLTDSFIIKGKTAIRFKTPESVSREIVSFDRHHDFAAGEYQLSATPPTWSNPRKRSDNGKYGGGPSNQPKVRHKTVRVRTVAV